MKNQKRLILIGLMIFTVIFLVGTLPVSAANVNIPEDESPHSDSQMEWWYFTGHLSGKDWSGITRTYGYEVTVIRMKALGEDLPVYNGHFAITDHQRDNFKHRMDFFGLQADNVIPGGGFNITVGGVGKVHMEGKNGENNIHANFADTSYTITLSLDQTKPTVLHGDNGLIPYGPFEESYYYSQTDLQVSGVMTDHWMSFLVTGQGWMDHQWGNFEGVGGWEWSSIQLDNGQQYMIYYLTDANGDVAQMVGTLVESDGSYTNLDPAQLNMTPLGTWTSSVSGLTFNSGWEITVPAGTITLTPVQVDQELYSEVFASMSGAGCYWEGDCTVDATLNGVQVGGLAYQEITPTFELPIIVDIGELLGL